MFHVKNERRKKVSEIISTIMSYFTQCSQLVYYILCIVDKRIYLHIECKFEFGNITICQNVNKLVIILINQFLFSSYSND